MNPEEGPSLPSSAGLEDALAWAHVAQVSPSAYGPVPVWSKAVRIPANDTKSPQLYTGYQEEVLSDLRMEVEICGDQVVMLVAPDDCHDAWVIRDGVVQTFRLGIHLDDGLMMPDDTDQFLWWFDPAEDTATKLLVIDDLPSLDRRWVFNAAYQYFMLGLWHDMTAMGIRNDLERIDFNCDRMLPIYRQWFNRRVASVDAQEDLYTALIRCAFPKGMVFTDGCHTEALAALYRMRVAFFKKTPVLGFNAALIHGIPLPVLARSLLIDARVP